MLEDAKGLQLWSWDSITAIYQIIKTLLCFYLL